MECTTNTLKEVKKRYCTTSKVVQFYKGKSIFITGATGFLGLTLIEKLLYTCPSIGIVYVLIKEKHGKTIEDRLATMLESPAFNRIKQQQPDVLNKIVPIKGDVIEHNLGMTDNDIILLQKEVSIVFHVAADISFSMNVPNHIRTNTMATEKLINICKGMRNLLAFVYVSSAYSQCNRSIVDETFYDLAVPAEKVYELINVTKSQNVFKHLREGRPNAYTYSKAMAELVVRDNADKIPAAVVRPTQVTSAVKDPMPGWISSWAGSSVYVENAGRGLFICWHTDPENIMDIVPVDYVVNVIIAAAWDTHNRSIKAHTPKEKSPKIFNFSTFVQNPIGGQRYMSICLEHYSKMFGKNVFTNRIFIFSKYYIIYWILLMLCTLAVAIVDIAFRIFGRKERLLKIHKALIKYSYMNQWFTNNEMLVMDDNVRRLYESLNETDQELFDFNVSHIQWEDYLRDHVMGINKYNPSIDYVKNKDFI